MTAHGEGGPELPEGFEEIEAQFEQDWLALGGKT